MSFKQFIPILIAIILQLTLTNNTYAEQTPPSTKADQTEEHTDTTDDEEIGGTQTSLTAKEDIPDEKKEIEQEHIPNPTDTEASVKEHTVSAAFNPLSPPLTRTPRDTLFEFINKMNQSAQIIFWVEQQAIREGGLFHQKDHIKQGYHAEELLEQAIRTLDLSDIPEGQRQHIGWERAMMLKDVLDRIPLPKPEDVPGTLNDDAGNTIKIWELPGTEILLSHIQQDEHHLGEYLFSKETVDRIPEFYNEVRTMPRQAHAQEGMPDMYLYYTSTPGHLLPPKWSLYLPEWSTNVLYWDQTPWQWFALLVTLLLLLIISSYIIRIYRRVDNPATHTFLDVSLPLVLFLLTWGALYIIRDVLNITDRVFAVTDFALEALMFILASWATYVTFNWIAEYFFQNHTTANSISGNLFKTLLRIISIIAAGTVIYFGAESLSIPIAPLLAGFGALGIAVGMGAQEYFKNVVGGLTLFIDRPVHVGDYCEFGDIRGSVENIGLRSTRIRTPDKTLVTVPNLHFSNANIVNHSMRPSRVLKTTLGLRYETSRGQIQQVMQSIRDYLDSHPMISSQRVNFDSLGDFSLNINVKATVDTHDIEEFLAVQEAFLLEVMKIVEETGTDFAFPSQTLYMGQDQAPAPT